ncbi:MAG: TolC family protein [Acidobacteriaceae bacterium]|nr:TolC family protein [Acidobacteriaceae bacterium]
MVEPRGRCVFSLCALLVGATASAQQPPPTPERPWNSTSAQSQLKPRSRPAPAFVPDRSKVYALPELIDIAERNNPATRVAWESARARAAELGIEKATLYPTLLAAVLAESTRDNVFFGTSYFRQTIETLSPIFHLEYVIFDFGLRRQEIAVRQNELLAADFQFNDIHRNIIFQVMQAYYRLLDTKGEEDAARATLKNAQTVQQATEARLEQGLATLPDMLEARSATSQADYDLQAAIGATEIAHGDLATALGISPVNQFQSESIQHVTMPQEIAETVESSIDKALSQRPDLIGRVAALRAATAQVKAEQKTYLPVLRFDADAGLARKYGEQYPIPGVYSPAQETWNARLSLTWTLFDGWARKNRIVQAKANEKQAAAEVDAMRDQVENEVWTAYSLTRTALRQQKAAAALLASATESYNAALESYNLGVRNQIDVVSAQRTLAEALRSDVSARTQLLTSMAALALQTGDLLHVKGP